VKILVGIKRVSDPDNANRVKVAADGSKVDPAGLEQKLNPFDEYAVETALRLTENAAANAERIGEVVVVSMGPKEAATTIRAALAMGAERGILVDANDAAIDGDVVSRALCAIAKEEKPDLVIVGKQQVDGDSNQVGQLTAERLGWPQATFAYSIVLEDGGKTALVGREVDGGVLYLRVSLPAVVSVDLRIVLPKNVVNGVTPASHPYPDTPRYASLKGIMSAKKKPIVETTFAALGVDPKPAVRYVKFESPSRRQAGVKVESVADLVDKLHTQAKVL